MSKAVQDHFPRSINQYVPNMEFAADVVNGEVIVNLGSPAAADADGIWDGVSATNSATSYTSADFKSTFDGSSTSLTSTSGMIDAPYGRTLRMVGSAGSDHVCTITGKDYLGQVMTETFTLSGTTIQYGNKAFKFVDTLDIATGAASDTADVGWTDCLGLPYKTEKILSYSEDDAYMPHDIEALPFRIPATEYAAGTSMFIVSPLAGQVVDVRTTVEAATTGAGAITVEIAGAAVTGLSVVIATGASVGDLDNDVPTDLIDPTGHVDKWEDIELVGDGTPTAGSIHGVVVVDPLAFVAGIDTDPQTASTSDPRGFFLVTTACDGSIEYEVRCAVDLADLHGVEQV